LLLRQAAAVAVSASRVQTPPVYASAQMPAPVIRYSFVGSSEEELAHIRAALATCRGNKTRAAALLGMSRNTLLNKLRGVEL
jgi:transcriptional regulator of acetoin/glycerol metabolism